MSTIDLQCRDCGHHFQVVTRSAIKSKQKRCPHCGSESIRQTLSSYLRNGPLSSPSCGAPQRSSGFG
jgi:putative FmdB family regulatory protein